ncbi:Major allergen Pru av 1 [Morella rubra]|uniref:Major allergen Pru av 1 n=1 Tax=Morella rubra TaxID=262757 RepID=A0A6A1VM01_9ROSI|nr:Major allergen Pru av 1 [Morella rubra]
MGVFTYETESTSVIPSAKLFKAFVLDADNLIPKVAPQAIKTSEIVEGNGGPGTIKKITFCEGTQHTLHVLDETHLKESVLGSKTTLDSKP